MKYLYNPKIFIILFIILGIFILIVLLYPFGKPVKEPQQIKVVPTPTKVVVMPTIVVSQSAEKKINITPRFTGVNEDIPEPTLNAAMQKQALKKKTPLSENGFVITYDYQSDNFIVALSEPKQDNKQVFEQWLKQNYPLIPLNKFLFK
ncbi:hypothetical protein HY041_00965 [Candidatus Roizmanbacteria bacterium]|nr:hypothetical protein [Candidatus Roizmanbacteria bacterium]